MGESMAVFPDDIYKASKQQNRSSCHIYNYINQGGYRNSNGYDASVKTNGGLHHPQMPPYPSEAQEDDNQHTHVTIVTTPPPDSNNPAHIVINPATNSNEYHHLNAVYHQGEYLHRQQQQQQQQFHNDRYERFANNNLYVHPQYNGTGSLQIDRPGSPIVHPQRRILPDEVSLENQEQLAFIPYMDSLGNLAVATGVGTRGVYGDSMLPGNHNHHIHSRGNHHQHGGGGRGRVRPDSPIVHRTLLQRDTPLDPEVFIQDTLVEGLTPGGDITVVNNCGQSGYSNNVRPERPKSPVPDLIDDTR